MTPFLHGLVAATDDQWANEFLGFDANQRFVVVLVVVGCVTAMFISLFAIGANVISAMQRRRIEAEFKRELLDRGLSTEEIVAMVESSPPPEDAVGRMVASWCKKK